MKYLVLSPLPMAARSVELSLPAPNISVGVPLGLRLHEGVGLEGKGLVAEDNAVAKIEDRLLESGSDVGDELAADGVVQDVDVAVEVEVFLLVLDGARASAFDEVLLRGTEGITAVDLNGGQDGVGRWWWRG